MACVGVSSQDLLETVAYRMQPSVCAHLRGVAARTLAALPEREAAHYVGVHSVRAIRPAVGELAAYAPLWAKDAALRVAPTLARHIRGLGRP
jgi:hypothetical protein